MSKLLLKAFQVLWSCTQIPLFEALTILSASPLIPTITGFLHPIYSNNFEGKAVLNNFLSFRGTKQTEDFFIHSIKSFLGKGSQNFILGYTKRNGFFSTSSLQTP